MMSRVAAPRSVNLLQRIVTGKQFVTNLRIVSAASTRPAPSAADGHERDATPVKSYDEIPGPGGLYNIPYLGFLFHMKPFGNYTTGTTHLLFDEMIQRYGPIFKIRVNIPTVVITDPKDLAAMLRSEGKHPYRPNFEIIELYYKRTNSRPTVGALQGQDWWSLRAPTQKMLLKPRQLSQYLPQMNGVADDFIKMVLSGYLETHNVEETFMFYMAESAGTAFFNKRLGFLGKEKSEESKRMQQATLDVFNLLLKTMMGNSNAFRLYKSKDYRTFESALDYMRATTAKYVREAKEDLERMQEQGTFDPDKPNMLFSLLNEMPEEEAALIIEGVYFASIDSSAAGMQLVLYNLAQNPDKQEKLRDEIRDVVGDSENVTQEHIDKLPYLKACVKEMYRFTRIVPFGPVRVLPTDVVLGGYKIPAGVQIYNYNAKACRDENIFENPNSYEPERWLRQNRRQDNEKKEERSVKGDTDSNWAVLPFGVGPRMCPGRRLFEQELYLLLAKLIRKARVGLEPESVNMAFEYQFFLKPVKPIKFTFTSVDAK